jgi:hypothetical protein
MQQRVENARSDERPTNHGAPMQMRRMRQHLHCALLLLRHRRTTERINETALPIAHMVPTMTTAAAKDSPA